MSKVSTRLRRRREAKEQLSEIEAERNHVIVIHYSCESFYDRPDGTSPRITSIAVRNLATGQTTSFSIHQFAERAKKLPIKDNQCHDELERMMLKEFYTYADRRENHIWLHWNMRDINYGFQALEHRFKTLGGEPAEIPESHRRDLARLLSELYGNSYVGHPHLKCLAEKNDMAHHDFLSGEEEAAAFEAGNYVKLHQSTLRKGQVLSQIMDLASADGLKTDARRIEIYGSHFQSAMEKIKEHPLGCIIGLIGAIASIVSLVICMS